MIGSVEPSRRIPTLMEVPSLPRMRSMVSAKVVVLTGTPSMVAITSPERIPAAAAEDPSSGATTTT